MADIYRRLQQKLDTMSSGFPATESGIEIEILQDLFAEEEADIFLYMQEKPEKIEAAHARIGGEVEELGRKIDEMSHKGLLRRDRKGDSYYYSAVPFVVGIFEHQLNRIDKDLAQKFETYFDMAFGKTIQAHGTPVMRTVPVNQKIDLKWPVAPFDDAARIIDNQKVIALAPCICRTTTTKAGKGCDNPLETCLIFGSYAEYYVDNGMGRYISPEEAKEVITKSEEAGLVLQPFNAQAAGGLCSCCGCCCGILRSIKLQPSPAEAVKSNYYAVVDADNCNGCEICLDRCQVEAITVDEDGLAHIDLNRCIGCGLCVTTCATEALELVQKNEEEFYTPPKTGMRTYIEINKARQAKGEIAKEGS